MSTKKNKLTLYALFGVTIVPIAAAYFMFFTGIGVPERTVNSGVFLPKPVNVKAILLPDQAAELARFDTEKRWRLLIPVPKLCNDQCQQNLYTTRQVHIRLGEKSVRVERVAVNLAGQDGSTYLDSIAADHPLLKRVTVTEQQWQQWMAKAEFNQDMMDRHYYLLVDQEGFAMMEYDTTIHGNDLLKDLKRALKYSIEYPSP
jgi:hypothetical protein